MVHFVHHIYFMSFTSGLLWSLLGVAFAQDCSGVFSGSGKRFLVDDFYNTFNKLPKEIKDVLPGNREIDPKCRFDLTNLRDSQRATLKSLYEQGYSICVGCGYTNSDHGRCHSIDVCAKGSRCISARNEQRYPTYYWHGCCDASDKNCVTRNERIQFHVSNNFEPSITYIKKSCTTPLCNENGYTDQKNALISFLTNSSPVTLAPSTAAPSPINGGWTQWSKWGSCNKSCDIGTRIRTRACTQPVPQNGGAQCDGNDKELEICNAIPCS